MKKRRGEKGKKEKEAEREGREVKRRERGGDKNGGKWRSVDIIYVLKKREKRK